jgi:Fe2+ transport system protein B
MQLSCHQQTGGTVSNKACVILVGNPNVGKTVIFGALTGRYVTVSNYPGTTVEITEGALPDGTVLIDTPGTNTLSGTADDERVTRDMLCAHEGDIRTVVQVAATGAFLIGFLRRDYGAAGLFAMALARQLNSTQVVVSLIVITLFVPCVANVMMIIKEYEGQVALGVCGTVFPVAFLVGRLARWILQTFHLAV